MWSPAPALKGTWQVLAWRQAPTSAWVVWSKISKAQGEPLALMVVDAESVTESPAATVVRSADRSIWGVNCPCWMVCGSDAVNDDRAGDAALCSELAASPPEQLAPKPEFGQA